MIDVIIDTSENHLLGESHGWTIDTISGPETLRVHSILHRPEQEVGHGLEEMMCIQHEQGPKITIP